MECSRRPIRTSVTRSAVIGTIIDYSIPLTQRERDDIQLGLYGRPGRTSNVITSYFITSSFRSKKLEVRNKKLAIRSRKLEVRSRKLEVRS